MTMVSKWLRTLFALVVIVAIGSVLPATGAFAAVNRCSSSQLMVSGEPDPGSGGAGHYGIRIVFLNTASSPCSMYGYPGVSFVTGPNGSQVNDPADRASGVTKPRIVVPAEGVARSVLRLVRAENYDASACRPTWVPGLRVYPPDEYDPLYVSMPLKVCSANGYGVPVIYPVDLPS